MILPHLPIPQPAPVPLGSIIRFAYPTANEIGRLTRLRPRCLLVQEVRDTAINPIEPWAIVDNPLRRRGRWLLKGVDLDLGQERSFYWESMRGQVQDNWLKLGFVDQFSDDDGIHFVDGLYAPTRADRIYLSKLIQRFNELIAGEEDEYRNLGVFSLGRKHESRSRKTG